MTKPTKREVTNGIGRYLDEVEAGAVNGKRTVHLGALKGFPQSTDDPEVVARAIKEVQARAQEGTAIERLRRTQRVLNLTRALDELTAATEDTGEAQAFFIKHALAWATEHGIGYSAFRAMGVPAAVLREAGMSRGWEPPSE